MSDKREPAEHLLPLPEGHDVRPFLLMCVEPATVGKLKANDYAGHPRRRDSKRESP